MAKHTSKHTHKIPEELKDFVKQEAGLPSDANPIALGIREVITSRGVNTYYFVSYYIGNLTKYLRRKSIPHSLYAKIGAKLPLLINKVKRSKADILEDRKQGIEYLISAIEYTDLEEEDIDKIFHVLINKAMKKNYYKSIKRMASISDVAYRKVVDKLIQEDRISEV